VEAERPTLCESGPHRWDAQSALRKGGVEFGDLCDCGETRFGLAQIVSLIEGPLRDAGGNLAQSTLYRIAGTIMTLVAREWPSTVKATDSAPRMRAVVEAAGKWADARKAYRHKRDVEDVSGYAEHAAWMSAQEHLIAAVAALRDRG
jgi:hypothetical protein